MKAIVYKGSNSVNCEYRKEPKINKSTDVIVKITLTGVCGTDLRIYSGNFPGAKDVVLGHEAIGNIEEIGKDVTTIKVGDRVVIDPTLFDGKCYYCQKGFHNLCDNKANTETGVDKDGTFAEYIVMPEDFVYLLPDTISDDRAVLIEPLTCVLNNLEALKLAFDDKLVILGGGPIGTLFAMVAEKMALKTVIVEKRPERLNFLRNILSNSEVVDANDKNYIDGIVKKFGRKPNAVVDATGCLFEEALELVDKGGRIVLMGFNSNYKATISPLYITNNAITIIGAGDYNNMFIRAIDMAENIDLEKLITHRFKLSEAEDAFKILVGEKNVSDKNEIMKVVFEM
ncbi:alcohol dehydrogenase catalytic domain-containing protein [Clostridium sp. HBUAS56017]|uniref:zinc-dependent alcohol dehydrogenase n=1 Tax=Clostridium sp. HBUAS56017 TaxID=2571128 RepID=UPI001178006B|nr:alcohol dehydrogenase catalytic domain-containing protein [Clostridium sp. HBUAS56017]